MICIKSWKGKDKLSKRACTAAHTCSLTLPKCVLWAFPHSIKRIADSGGSHVAEWQMFKLPLVLCPLRWRGCQDRAPICPSLPLSRSLHPPCAQNGRFDSFFINTTTCTSMCTVRKERAQQYLLDAAGVEKPPRCTWSPGRRAESSAGGCALPLHLHLEQIAFNFECKVLLIVPPKGGTEGGTRALWSCVLQGWWHGKSSRSVREKFFREGQH